MEISLKNGRTISQKSIKNITQSLLMVLIIDHLEDQTTNFPFLGDLLLNDKGNLKLINVDENLLRELKKMKREKKV